MSKSIVSRLEGALLETGMMNELFIDQIKKGEVTQEYVAAALQNFRAALHPKPFKVQQRYVLGFLFNEDGSKILLMFKKRPAWQKGLLNGLGGKIEEGETPEQAMKREFSEETFVAHVHDIATNSIQDTHWHYVGRRHRVALYDQEPGSYEMFIYAALVPDVRRFVWEDRADFNYDSTLIQWRTEAASSRNREMIVALPLNREILARRGVPGLAWTVDIALQSIRENFTIDVEDPPSMNLEGSE